MDRGGTRVVSRGTVSTIGFTEAGRRRSMNTRVVNHEEWLAARKQHLIKEKEFTRLRDELSRQRRELPRERVENEYVFEGPHGKESLSDLFGGHSQLIVYHFMFGPGWAEGCPSCSFLGDHFGGMLPHLEARGIRWHGCDIMIATKTKRMRPRSVATRLRAGTCRARSQHLSRSVTNDDQCELRDNRRSLPSRFSEVDGRHEETRTPDLYRVNEGGGSLVPERRTHLRLIRHVVIAADFHRNRFGEYKARHQTCSTLLHAMGTVEINWRSSPLLPRARVRRGLLVSKRRHRVHLHRPSCRHVAGQQGDSAQDRCDRDIRHRVGPADVGQY